MTVDKNGSFVGRFKEKGGEEKILRSNARVILEENYRDTK